MATVLIVGGTSGIGEATARAFAARGDDVVVAGRDRGRLEGALARLGDGVRGEALDAADADAVRAAAERLAPIDVLVLAASGGSGGLGSPWSYPSRRKPALRPGTPRPPLNASPSGAMVRCSWRAWSSRCPSQALRMPPRRWRRSTTAVPSPATRVRPARGSGRRGSPRSR